MRVATYTQPMAVPGGSFVALCVLVLTVLLGSSALHTLMAKLAPQLHQGIVALWLVTYLIAFMGLMLSHGINWISWLSRYRILLVILLLGTTVSVSWSLDAAVSAERVVHLLGCSVLAIYLGFMIPLLTTLRITAVVMAVIMLASLAAAMFMPSVGMEEYEGSIVWSGILNSKNALGFWAAIAVLLYVTLSASSQTVFMKLMCFVMALVSLYVLIKSDSATSLLAMLVGGSLSLYLYIAFRFQLGFIRMAVLAVLFGGLFAFALSNIDTAQIVGRSGDLTGRGEVWRQTWKLIMKQPLTGYGYGSLWFPNDATLWIQQSLTDFTWVVYHAHNGFLQVASEIGLPLSCIALLMVAQQLIEIFYCQYERQQVGVLFVLAFVVAYLISNFSEARFLVNRELYWIFFLALPISMLRQINLVSTEELDEEDWQPAGGPAGQGYVPPGKPWLRPIHQKDAAKIGTAGAAYGGASAVVERLRIGNDENGETAEFSEGQLPHLTLTDNTDIDLGEDDTGRYDATGRYDINGNEDASVGYDVSEGDTGRYDMTDHDDAIDRYDTTGSDEIPNGIEDLDLSLSGDATLDTTLVVKVDDNPVMNTSEYTHVDDMHDVEGMKSTDVLDTSLVDDYNAIDHNLDHHPDDYNDSDDGDEMVIRPYEEYEDESFIKLETSDDDYIVDDTGIDEDRYDKTIDADDDDDEWIDVSSNDH